MQLVRSRASRAQRRLEQQLAFGDPLPVPAGPVLVGEQHQVARAVDAGVPPRVGEQQEREQARGLRLVRQQRGQRAGEPDRLVASSPRTSSAPRWPGALGCRPGRRRAARPPAGPAARPGQAPASGCRPAVSSVWPGRSAAPRSARDHEGGRDGLRVLAAHAAQRQRDPRGRLQRGMAAHEDQPELVGCRPRSAFAAMPEAAGVLSGHGSPGPRAPRPADRSQPPPPCRPAAPPCAAGPGPCAWPRRPATHRDWRARPRPATSP